MSVASPTPRHAFASSASIRASCALKGIDLRGILLALGGLGAAAGLLASILSLMPAAIAGPIVTATAAAPIWLYLAWALEARSPGLALADLGLAGAAAVLAYWAQGAVPLTVALFALHAVAGIVRAAVEAPDGRSILAFWNGFHVTAAVTIAVMG